MGPKKKPRGRPFEKGNKANPSGRPPKSANLPPSERTRNRLMIKDVRELARATGPDDIRTLIAIRDDEKAPYACRIMAANSLLDRGFGRPSVSVDTSATLDVTVQEIDPLELIEGKLAAIHERLQAEGDLAAAERLPVPAL
jgi:hypothetical protein